MVLFTGTRSQSTAVPFTKSIKFILQEFKATIDAVHIKEFRQISTKDNIYNCKVVKDIRSFYIDVAINQMGKNRQVYRLNNMEGCVFLSNTLLNRIFHGFYENLVVNGTSPIKCPIKKGNYLFRNAFNKNALPQIHPKGNFSLNLRLKANTHDQIILDLQWIYRLIKA
ncbi:uncharacterized protein [Musca autumnalis]|uniref:uncharacterized protein n=1 Tax=Musca autumnalis TaxID=221902 RepID=UPI003CEDCAE0